MLALQAMRTDSPGRPLTKTEEEQLLRAYEESYQQNVAPIAKVYHEKLSQLRQTIEQADRNIEEADRNIEEADRGIAQSRERQRQLAKEKLVVLTGIFYSIFNGKNPIPADEVNALFETYLSDGSLTVGETSEGKSYPKINSMRAITRYIDDHPTVKMCDFRPFKTEISDIATLADYLKKSNVRAIALNSGIPTDAKTLLSEAIASRSGGLKVQYFA